MRQLAYPVCDKPEDDDINEFILYHGSATYQELLRRIVRAWEKVNVKENGVKRKNMATKESYTRWVKERVRLVKLPFVVDPTYCLDIPDSVSISVNEFYHLKETIARLKKEKESLEYNLYDNAYEKNQLRSNLKQRE